MDAILETHQVSKHYESQAGIIKAVDDVSLAVRPGEFISVVGPSGSGKTTLLALLAGLMSPTEGQVLIGGMDVAELSESARAKFRREKIGFTFQANNLVPYLNVLENVELAARLKGPLSKEDRTRARTLLDRLGLGDRLSNLPSQLSGGQQQRVAIARALVHEPLIVLADEPTASLDSERGRQVVETFRQLVREQNRAGVMVTHDLRMVRYTDAVVRMVDGGIVDVLRDPESIRMLSGMHDRVNGMSTGTVERRQAAGVAGR